MTSITDQELTEQSLYLRPFPLTTEPRDNAVEIRVQSEAGFLFNLRRKFL